MTDSSPTPPASPVMARPVSGATGGLFARLTVLLAGMPSRGRVAAELGLVILAFMGPVALNHLPEAVSPDLVLALSWGLGLLVLVTALLVMRVGVRQPSARISPFVFLTLLLSVFGPLGFAWYLDYTAGRIYQEAVQAAAATCPAKANPVASATGPDQEFLAPAQQAGIQACNAYLQNTRLDLAAVHGLAIVVLTLLILRARGQSLAQLGLSGRGWLTDLAWSVPTLGAVYVALVVSSVLLILLVLLLPQYAHVEAEVTNRIQVVENFLPQLSLGKLVLLMVVVGAYEEIVFRGFLIPRLKYLTGSWVLALLLAVGLFGIGHRYLGDFAVFQTSFIGLTLGLVFLWRGRLLTAIAAHALFNSIQFVLIGWILSSGLLPKAQELLNFAGS